MLKMILNLISVALLALIYFVCEKQQINPIWELEYYLFKCQKYRTLAKVVRAVNRSFTSAERRQIQLDLIGCARTNIKEFHEILQREIYLLEEQDALKKKALYTRLDQDEDTLLKKIAKDLKQTKPRLWANAKEFDDLAQRGFGGSWTFEFDCTREYTDGTWRRHRKSCIRRLGCCARTCGCCEMPRRARGGPQTLTYPYRSHCTSECGCCTRWRGFDSLQQPERCLRSD